MNCTKVTQRKYLVFVYVYVSVRIFSLHFGLKVFIAVRNYHDNKSLLICITNFVYINIRKAQITSVLCHIQFESNCAQQLHWSLAVLMNE